MNILSKMGICAVMLTGCLHSQATEILKANNADALNLTSSWQGGVVPLAGDIAVWTNGSGSSPVSLGADAFWAGIKVYNPGATPTIGGSFTLNLGSNGITLGTGNNLTLTNPLVLTTNQTWGLGTKSLALNMVSIKGTNVTIDVTSTVSSFIDTKALAGGLFGTINYNASARFRVLNAFDATNLVLNMQRASFNANSYIGTTRLGDLVSTNPLAALSGSDQNGTVTYEIGALGNTSTWAGKILNGGASGTTLTSIRKVGAGTWSLSGTNTYTGTTTIDGGAIKVLSLNSQLGAAATGIVTVNTPNGLRFGNGLTAFPLYGLAAGTNGSIVLTNDLGNPVVLTLNQVSNTIFAGPLSGGGGITMAGSGTLTLAGANTYSGMTTVSSGKLVTTTASTGAGAYSVAGSAILSVKLATINGTLNMSSLTADASSAIEVNLATLGMPAANSPVITVSGDFTPTANVTLQVINGGPNLTTGQFPLIKYGNAVSPGLGSLTLVVPSGVTANLVDNTANQSIDLNITAITSLVWDGTVDGNWDVGTTANWKTGVPYTETAIGGPSVRFDDTAVGANTTISSGSAITVSPMSVTVSNTAKVYEIGGNVSIGGTASLTKQGTNTLTLSSGNSYSGGTVLAGGRLNINNASFGGSGPFTINGGVLDNTSGADVTVSQKNVQIWNGDFTYLGSANNLHLGAGAVTLTTNRQVSVEGNKLTVGGAISGPFSLTKAGAGVLALTNVNSLTGGIIVNAGTLTLAAAINNSIGSGPLTLNGGLVNLGYNAQYTNPIAIVGAATVQGSANNYDMRGALTGSGTLTLTRANAGVVWFSGDVSGFNGTVICDGTGFPFPSNSFGPITNGNSWAGVSVELINGARFRGQPNSVETPGTNRLGALSGDSSSTFGYFGGIYEIGFLGTTNTFSGVIADTGTNLTTIVKVGTGKWVLANANTYSGSTWVNAGVLHAQVAGSLGGSNVTVGAGAAVEMDDAAAMNSASSLFLHGTTNIAKLNYAGTQTINTLYINNSPCVAGVWGAIGSGAANENAAFSGPGTLTVSVTGPSNVSNTPTNITYQVTGGSLVLSWPADHLGWFVQSNSVSLTDSNAWFDVPGSQLVTNWNITISPALPNVFYRMRNP